MEKGDRLVQPISTVYLDETVSCLSIERIEKERNENVTTLLKMFLRLVDEVLADLMTERLQDQGCAPFLRSVYLSI